jgi:hypothetical protein
LAASRSKKRRWIPESASLETIKKKLDPAFSHVIFEKDGLYEPNAWIALYASLGGLSLPILQVQTFDDPEKRKMFLVATFEAGRADMIMEEIIRCRLPRDMVSYVYGSSKER